MSESETLPTARRAVRLDGIPTVSVVVASCRERILLDACLDSLLPQATEHGAEVIVARTDDDGLDRLRSKYPGVRVVPMPSDADIPRLRGAGMAVADGDVVLLTEDHCVVSENWISALVNSNSDGSDVVGGSMGNAQGARVVDWGAYFSEYGFFAERGGGDDRSPMLTGANVAYGKDVVKQAAQMALNGEWESVVHQELARSGKRLSFARAAVVLQNKSYRFWAFCRDRYEHGRDYARRRLVDETPRRRWLFLMGVAALPFLLTLRVAKAAGMTNRVAFLRSLPCTFSFLTAWSLGEAVGYLRGAPPVHTR